MPAYQPSRSPCPLGRASRVLGDRWVMLILREALLGVDRFEQFKLRLDISRAVLTDRLAMLVAAGLLRREPDDAVRAPYRLTEAGRALAPIFERIAGWSADYLFTDETAEPDWSASPPAI